MDLSSVILFYFFHGAKAYPKDCTTTHNPGSDREFADILKKLKAHNLYQFRNSLPPRTSSSIIATLYKHFYF